MNTESHVDHALASDDSRFRAMADNDVAALSEVLADDLHYVHANGMIEDKAEILRKIVSGERRYRSASVVEREAHAHPGFVVVFGRAKLEVMVAAGLLDTTIDYTAVYRSDDPRLYAYHAVKTRTP